MELKNPCTYNSNGYFIEGKPLWIASGEFQYFRMSKEDWEPRLLQIKVAGFNTISAYFAWNFHEEKEGVWDFSGDKDVEYFLKTAADLGLYVVARPGPFICNEWEGGGIPAWLSAKKGIRIRTEDELYLSYCDKWWDKIAPILARYQLGAEGTIIMAQVENEYGHMGIYQEENYIYHLRDGLRKHGIRVPIINCDSFIQFDKIVPKKWEGINLCCNCGGDGIRVLDRARRLQEEAPLFVTEFWIAAFDWWNRGSSAIYDDNRALYGALEMVAGGAGGLTVFVFSGGANFGYWHGQSICSDSNFITTLYGPGAPILDDGQFSNKYNHFKTAFTGLMSASGLLAQASMPKITGDMNGLLKAVRTSGESTFTFYINHSKQQMQIADAEKEQAAVDMSIPAGEVWYQMENIPLTEGFKLLKTNAQIFTADPALVCWADSGEMVTIEIFVSEAELIAVTGGEFKIIEQTVTLYGKVPDERCPLVWTITCAECKLTVVLVSKEEINNWYNIELPGMPSCIIGGVNRIEKVDREKKSLRIFAEEKRPCWKVDASGCKVWDIDWFEEIQSETIALTEISVSTCFPEAESDFDDTKWFWAAQPQKMAAFGHGNARAWYRTTLVVEKQGWQMIYLSGASDRWMFFVNGKMIAIRGSNSHFGKDLAVYLPKGEHSLVILVENLGMYNTGAEMNIPLGEPKGIYGPIWMNGEEIIGWRMRQGIREDEGSTYWEGVADNEWLPYKEDSDESVPIKGPCWLRGSIIRPKNFMGSVRLNLIGGGKGSVWVNGFNIGRYWKLGPQQSLWIPCSKLKDLNEIVLLEEESILPKSLQVEFTSYGISGEGII